MLGSNADLEFSPPTMELRCPHCKILLKRAYPKKVNGVELNSPPDQIYDHDIESCKLERL